MAPRFSIVTITLNSERYLRQTLESTAVQTFSDFEHLVWDGGSSDATLAIAKSFPHVRIVHGFDRGIGDALNQAIQAAEGQWVVGLHSDDLLGSQETLETLSHYDAPWIYGRAQIIDAAGEIMRTTDFIPYKAKRLRRYNILTYPAVALDRDLFIDIGGFRTDLRYAMDYDLWLRLSRRCEALAIPEVIAQFREHAGSLSTADKLAVTDEAYQVRNEHLRCPWERWLSYRTWKRRRRRERAAMLTKQRAISPG